MQFFFVRHRQQIGVSDSPKSKSFIFQNRDQPWMSVILMPRFPLFLGDCGFWVGKEIIRRRFGLKHYLRKQVWDYTASCPPFSLGWMPFSKPPSVRQRPAPPGALPTTRVHPRLARGVPTMTRAFNLLRRGSPVSMGSQNQMLTLGEMSRMISLVRGM